jgi:hypothetical protein
MSSRYYFSVSHDHGTDRHLTDLGGKHCLLDRFAHEKFIIIYHTSGTPK